MDPMTDLTNDELSALMQTERQRVAGPEHYSVWYDRGWFRTSKGNAYRRSDVEAFLERWKSKPDWDGTPEPEDGPSVFSRPGR